MFVFDRFVLGLGCLCCVFDLFYLDRFWDILCVIVVEMSLWNRIVYVVLLFDFELCCLCFLNVSVERLWMFIRYELLRNYFED